MLRYADGSDEVELSSFDELTGDDFFTIEPLFHDDAASLVLCGEIDCAAIPELEGALETVAARRPGSLVVDLSGATFLSVAAVHCLVRASQELSEVVWYKESATTEKVRRLLTPPERTSPG